MHSNTIAAADAAPSREIQAETSMRAEIERLVEEIKQSVGLLRRHL